MSKVTDEQVQEAYEVFVKNGADKNPMVAMRKALENFNTPKTLSDVIKQHKIGDEK